MKTTSEMIESRCLFGSHVKEVRKEQNLTQTQLGTIIGLDRSYISRLERGCCNVTLDTIVLLARGLNIAPADLLSDITIQPPSGESPLPVMLGLTHKQARSYQK